MEKLEKYTSYKDSGVEWLGEIPEGWEVKRTKNIFNFSKGLTITKDNLQEEGVYCINYGEIHSKFGFEVNPEIHSLKCVDESYLKSDLKSLLNFGDFIFADTSEDIEGSGNFTHLNSNIQTFAGYHTVICRANKNENFRFFAYIFDSITYRLQIRKRVKGVKVYSITQGILKDTILWIPSKQEQIKIVSFLDEKITQIDAIISQKQKLIELLKEQRQIVINEAVTKGLDKNVEFINSGVEWIGEIPKHWEVSKVKNIFNLIIDPAPKANDEELLSIYTDIGVKPRKELAEKGNKASTTDGYWRVKKGDFIVNKLLAWMGAVGLSEYEGVTSPAYDILRAKKDIAGRYYHELFRLKVFSQEMKKYSRGIMDMRLRLYFDKFGDILIPYPSHEEQIRIVEYIDNQNEKINKAIELQQNYISKLKEYKATLIDSVVTGKVRVV